MSVHAIPDNVRGMVGDLRGAGYSAYLVGGCVRDLLLQRPPSDYDIATSAHPSQILAMYPRGAAVGARFGVVLVDGVEITTYRSDHDYRDGRHPGEVRFESDPRADAMRRDFTINALFLDPDNGAVLDFAGGRDDLARGLIRAVGDPDSRFTEDHLRMLRAVRFAARLGFAVDPPTMDAIRRQAGRIHSISAERVRDEIARILTEGNARRGFELLDESGLLVAILPEIAAMKGVAQPPEFHPEGDVWIHTLLMLGELRDPTLTLALSVLLHDVGKPPTFRVADRIRFDGHAELGAAMAVSILERLKFPGDVVRRVEALVAQHMRFRDVTHMRESTLKRFLRGDDFGEHCELHRIDCISSHGLLDNWTFVKRKLDEMPAEQLRPPRLLTGDDLIAMGLVPGPAFRTILEAVETAQLEGSVSTREDAEQLARELYAG